MKKYAVALLVLAACGDGAAPSSPDAGAPDASAAGYTTVTLPSAMTVGVGSAAEVDGGDVVLSCAASSYTNNANIGLVCRFHGDTTPDASFGAGGCLAIDDAVLAAIAPIGDGVLIGGSFPDNRIEKLDATGQVDPSFALAIPAPVTAILRERAGSYLAVLQSFNAVQVLRFDASGAVTLTGPSLSMGWVYQPALTPSGDLLLTDGQSLMRVRASDLALDPAFGQDGVVMVDPSDLLMSLATLGSGEILAGFYCNNLPCGVQARDASGRTDATFGTAGQFATDMAAWALRVRSDGGIVIGGTDLEGYPAVETFSGSGAVENDTILLPGRGEYIDAIAPSDGSAWVLGKHTGARTYGGDDLFAERVPPS